MAYGICRCMKVSAPSAGSGSYIHNERKKDHSNSNPDIDFSRSAQNYSVGTYNLKLNYNQRADIRIKEGYTGKRAVRKDAVRMVEFLFAPSSADSLTPKQQKKFFEDCYKWLCDRYGKENVIADTVHLDESTPHMHAIIVPLTKDGRLSCKEIMGGPKQMQELQDDFFKKVSSKYNLERGERADLQDENRQRKKHLTDRQFKEQKNAELDKEITDKKEKSKDLDFEIEIRNDAINRYDAQIDQRLKQIDFLDKELEDKHKALDKARTERLELQGDISTLKTDKSKLEASVSVLEGEKISLEQDIDQANINLQNTYAECRSVEKDVSRYKGVCKALESGWNDEKGHHPGIQELKKTRTELNKSIADGRRILLDLTEKVKFEIKNIFLAMQSKFEEARRMAPINTEIANDKLDDAEDLGKTRADAFLKKELADPVKEAVGETVEETAQEIAKQTPQFIRRRRRGR